VEVHGTNSASAAEPARTKLGATRWQGSSSGSRHLNKAIINRKASPAQVIPARAAI
jgi:hypothetical protein